jgi:HTH-type transcriptional regulator / antitoxin HigA
MSATKTKNRPDTLHTVYGRGQDRYLELIRVFPLRPIRNEDEQVAAIKVIDALIDAPSLTPPEQDYLDVISDLLEAYEDVHEPEPEVSDAEMLAYLMDIQGRTQTDVARGAKIAASTVSEVLSGKRKLNRGQIGKLARYFHVGPGVFSFDE